jgi:hypothetical protein
MQHVHLFEETERPTEWLRALSEGRRLYASLVDEAGNFAVAAWRIARARCRIQSMPSAVPTSAELCVAAAYLAEATGSPRPPSVILRDECERRGLPVL